MAKVQSWTSRFLSYADRVQVIKSVFFSIHFFGPKIFVMPKKIINLEELILPGNHWLPGKHCANPKLLEG
ncbi:hypothetical protein H5410_011757 [Solanum commersonii]|uniref:Uncharacterized protein n=1 Tax=Solanum commersonii TaxID=4109 RepID=A0A9J6AQL0_SOLCO|nr:hypothetical protein H5410_011757 [Solanum commersonii]